ncbi:MAG TPA: hypothetical protein DHV36_25910 [Desulfobacteraceae bacterium]|nr:hypothetical protein [Desulfobacteraceae bacterium]
MPLAGQSAKFTSTPKSTDTGWTVGGYLDAAAEFLCKAETSKALAAAMGSGAKTLCDTRLSLFLEKHGAYYHPIRVVARNEGKAAVFVLNGAVTGQGLALIEKEVGLLNALVPELGRTVIPEVYAAGKISGAAGYAGFFLGPWFEGFHEFHITGNGDRVVIWRPGDTDLALPLKRALPIYENIAALLTRAYDKDCGREIFPWHHAAGDFIVDPLDDTMQVRLITVRGYDRLSGMDVAKTGPYPPLLFFLLNLSLRMRLDRIDGVGDAVFLSKSVLHATLKGFFRGLGSKGLDDPEFLSGFTALLAGLDVEQLLGILIQELEVWPPGPSEVEIIRAELAAHCAEISALFNSRDILDFY